MRKASKFSKDVPTAEQIQKELNRIQYKSRFRQVLRSTVYTLIVVAAVSVLVATIWMPVLQIYGTSMVPTLDEGDIVVTVKTTDFTAGDLVSFYLGNKLLVKRYIAGPGSWVDIQKDGTVLVDGVELDEPYLTEKSVGICDLELPYQVPEETYFLMGDERETSVDSRHSSVGCISTEQIVGKIIYRVWPIGAFGRVR